MLVPPIITSVLKVEALQPDGGVGGAGCGLGGVGGGGGAGSPENNVTPEMPNCVAPSVVPTVRWSIFAPVAIESTVRATHELTLDSVVPA